MSPTGWVFLCVLCAAATGAVVFLLMRARAEVGLSRLREELAEARSALGVQKQALADSIKQA